MRPRERQTRNMFCRIISRAGSARSTRVHGPRSGGTGIQVTDPVQAEARADQIAVRDRIAAPGMVDPAAAEVREAEAPEARVRVAEAAAPAADRFQIGGIRSGGAVRPGIRERIGLRGASMILRMGHIGAGDVRGM